MKLPIGPTLAAAITLAYRAGRPVILEGPTGLGKSELMAEVAKSIDGGIGFRCIDLSLLEPPDLIGIPRIDDHNRTTYAIPDFWPDEGKGLLFFDELNRASPALLNPALQILTTRQIHGHPLPPGWIPMAAMNPATDNDYHGTNVLDRALLARFSVIQVTGDVSAWLTWAELHHVHAAVINYIRAVPDVFIGKHSNPRSWVYASDVLHAYDKGGFSLDALLAVVAGHVGDLLAFALLATIQRGASLETPDPEALIVAYGKEARESVRRLSKAGDTAKLMIFTRNLMLALQDPDRASEVQQSAKKHANIRKVIADLPAEYGASIIEHSPWIADQEGAL